MTQIGDRVTVTLGPAQLEHSGVIDAFLPGEEWVRILLDEPWPDQTNQLVNVPLTRVTAQ